MPRGPDKSVPASDILTWMVKSPDRAFTAGEIAEKYDKTRQWGHGTLNDLEEEGYVASKNPGGNSRFYWVTDEGKRYLQESESDSDGQ